MKRRTVLPFVDDTQKIGDSFKAASPRKRNRSSAQEDEIPSAQEDEYKWSLPQDNTNSANENSANFKDQKKDVK